MKRILTFTLLAVVATSMAQQGPGQGGGQRRIMGGGMGDQMVATLLMRPDVQTELGITAEQRTKLVEMFQSMGRGPGGPGGQGGQGGQQGGGQAGPGQGQGGQQGGPRGGGFGQMNPGMMAEQEAKIKEILTPTQWERLWELYVQRNNFRVILRPDFQEKLGLTDMQKAQVNTAREEQAEAMRTMMQEMRDGGGGQGDPQAMQAMMQKMQEMNQAYDAKLGEILTAEQKAKIEEMKGEKFEFQQMGPSGRGGGN